MAVTRILTGGVANNSITLAKMAHGTDGNIITYDAAGAPAVVATGTSGHVLTSGGAGVAPTFQAAGGGTPDDNSVTLAKMASGTDGNIISYDASGNPVAIATGTDGQVLTSTGAGSPPAFETAASSGATSINGLSDSLVENNSIWLGNDPSGTTDTAERNIAVGTTALDSITTGDNNVAIGYNALTTLATGYSNMGIGYEAGKVATNFNNIFIGNRAGVTVSTGYNNTMIGNGAGYSNAAVTGQVLIGHDAGYHNQTGGNNTIVGDEAGKGTAGNSNTENTLIGNGAGKKVTTGGQNTMLGSGNVGENFTSGSNCIFIGYQSCRSGSPGGDITTSDDIICIGDEEISAANIQVDWTIASDQRDKTDFTALDLGLDFVNALSPVTYKWDKRIKYVSSEDRGTVDLDTITHDGTHKEDWLDIGFKAQEVETLEAAAGYNISDKTNLTTSLTSDGKQYGIQYSKFIPILVNAIKELSAEIDKLKE